MVSSSTVQCTCIVKSISFLTYLLQIKCYLFNCFFLLLFHVFKIRCLLIQRFTLFQREGEVGRIQRTSGYSSLKIDLVLGKER